MAMYHQDEVTFSKDIVCFIEVYRSSVTSIDNKQKYIGHVLIPHWEMPFFIFVVHRMYN
jgi:hypothetical protein